MKTLLSFLAAFCAVSPAIAAPLDIAAVRVPTVHCKFDADCKVTVSDFVDHFTLTAASGDAFLQSRMLPVGEPGTVGEGLYPYEYRIDLRQLAGLTALPCIHTFKIPFGPVVPLDYDDDGEPDDMFVITAGGLGSVAPSSADLADGMITFQFDPPVCAGSSPGDGETTFFFGLASKRGPRAVTANLMDTLGGELDVEARAPVVLPELPRFPPFLRADPNGSGKVDIADAVSILGHIFLGEIAPTCMKAADANDSGRVDLSDAVFLLNFLFLGGGKPAAPFLACGVDPTEDELPCDSFAACSVNACPDPAAHAIDFDIVSRSTPSRGRVKITGTVKNLGGPYDSSPGQQEAQLYEVPLGGSPRLAARLAFTELAPDETVSVSYERDWDSASPGEGEFPPTYRLVVSYDPDIFIDGNDENDDCDGDNNRRERSGADINAMF